MTLLRVRQTIKLLKELFILDKQLLVLFVDPHDFLSVLDGHVCLLLSFSRTALLQDRSTCGGPVRRHIVLSSATTVGAIRELLAATPDHVRGIDLLGTLKGLFEFDVLLLHLVHLNIHRLNDLLIIGHSFLQYICLEFLLIKLTL